MILIGEAGGSKTDWRIINSDAILQFSAAGFNAALSELSSLEKMLSNDLLKYANQIKKVYFYAAGVGEEQRKLSITELFEKTFPKSQIEVNNDLFAAGRSLFGADEGIVGVLGTGSVLAHYRDGAIINRIPSLGYILGDEGSGFYLSKMLIIKVLRSQLPNDLNEMFFQEYPDFSEQSILTTTYREGHANQRIAQFTSFLQKHKEHPFVYSLIFNSFKEFFEAYNFGVDNKDLKWGFIGSIAFYFQDILKNVASHYNHHIDKVLKSPIEKLTHYHQENG